MSHFSLKSLAFYATAIGSVTVLFYLTSAYGEANLKAPSKIDGHYQVSVQNPPECLNSSQLLLLQQSGVYLTGSLLPVDASENLIRNAEERPSLTGHWENQQLILQGSINNCQGVATIQSTVQGTLQKGTIDQATLSGTIQLSATSTESSFTAKQKAIQKTPQNQGH